MIKGRHSTNRLRWLPLPIEFKEKIIQANVLPASLYGCEAAWANKSSLKALRSAIANALGPRSTRASNEIVFHITTTSKDLDPNTYIFTQRVLILRRTLSKYPEWLAQVKSIIGNYNQQLASDLGTSCLEVPQGPIALLMYSLKQNDATLTNDLHIAKNTEPSIDVWHLPWQHLEKAIEEAAATARIKTASAERQHMQGLEEIDAEAHKRVLHSLGPKERTVFNHITTGAAWSEQHKHDIGLSDGKCQLCNENATDMAHVLWECPQVNKHRQNKNLIDLDINILPVYIKHGLAKAMSVNTQGYFWGQKPTEDPMPNTTSCKATGLPSSNQHAIYASCKDKEIQDCPARHNIEPDNLNARQCFQALKSNKTPPHLAMPYRCHLPAPKDINVYTDGSWIHPLKQFLGMGGAGVWWPNRNPDIRHRLSTSEQELAYYQVLEGGVMLFTPIGGYHGSSTRTELAAAIVALMANGPIHIGTDSKAFMDKAIDILYKLRSDLPIKLNWKTMSDGDLWEHFTKAAEAKGPNSINITKVKGHVTTQQILDNIYRDVDKQGNDRADKAAEIAVNTHGEDVVRSAGILHKRHQRYIKFMKDVALHIVEAYLIHKELVDRYVPKKANTSISYTPLVYPECNDPVHLPLQGSVNYAKFNKKYSTGACVVNFLKGLTVQHTSNQQDAISWLELYILYRIEGFPKPIADNPNKARSRATVKMQLNCFKACTRGIINRLGTDQQVCHLFRPIKVTTQRFLGLAIQGKHLATSMSVSLHRDKQQAITDSLIKLGRQISGKKLEQFKDGTLQIMPRPLAINGRVGWDSKLGKGAKGIATQHQVIPTPPAKDPDPSQEPEPHNSKQLKLPTCFTCPACGAAELSNNKKFQLVDLDSTLLCKGCNKRSKMVAGNANAKSLGTFASPTSTAIITTKLLSEQKIPKLLTEV